MEIHHPCLRPACTVVFLFTVSCSSFTSFPFLIFIFSLLMVCCLLCIDDFGVLVSGSRLQVSGFRVRGQGFTVLGSGFRA